MESHQKILQSLIDYSVPISELSDRFSSLDWDYKGPCVVLSANQLTYVLECFLTGEVNNMEIETWADLIECRDGIEYEDNLKETIKEIIHKLSNPVLEGELTLKSCSKMLSILKKV